MNIRIGLYWQHDLDLVALRMHPDFEIGKWMKKAVIAFAKGDTEFRIPLPRPMPYRVELDNCSTHFALTPGKDDEIIACMNGFRCGQRNSAIKHIFRMYLEAPYLDPYYNEKTFIVKQRGYAKKDSVSADKKQMIPDTKYPGTAPVLRTNEKNNSGTEVPADSLPLSPVHVVKKHEIMKKETPLVQTESHSGITSLAQTDAAKEASWEETGSDTDDGFDLFGAVGEMID